MRKFTCPSCGADIIFQSGITVSAVCPYCRSLVVRHDVNVEAIGKMAVLPYDVSPFQIGTQGRYHNLAFSLAGRAKMGWEDGCWNEWFMYTNRGDVGWLAEAQGSLAISFEKDPKTPPPSTGQRKIDGSMNLWLAGVPALGATLNVLGKVYVVTDVKNATVIGSEGELPFTAQQGKQRTSADLMGNNGEFASIEYNGDKVEKLNVGEYVEFDDLQFTNLRDLPGWNIRRTATKGKHG
ncbi:MAG TPA: DUF4178 domain-containing protein [Patescibacteria group bacterium]|nr:DUF4178 domain-containing protein [Patescibacteria group bacterium]